jgi:putative transposase
MSYNAGMRKQYTATIKAKIVSELLQEEKTLTQLSSEYGVSSKQLIRWKNHVLTEMPRLFERKSEGSQEKYDNKINELYGEIGRLSTQVNWLKKKSGLNLEPD